MVMAAQILSLLLLSQPAFLGVVRVSRAETNLKSGAMLTSESLLETRSDSWMEVHLIGDSRLRLSADTTVTLRAIDGNRMRLDLSSGRIWIQTPANVRREKTRRILEIRSRKHTTFVQPWTSVVIEFNPAIGAFTATPRVGLVRVLSDDGRFEEASPGEVIETKLGLRTGKGGLAMQELVAAETRSGLGDLVGLKATLLEWTRSARIGAHKTRGVSEILRLDPEVSGATNIHSRTLEDAVRPAPFFEQEVPLRGPNVSVEVEFRGE